MNIKAIQEIRNAEQNKKFELLVEEVCGRGASKRRGLVLELEQALHKFEKIRFSVSPGYHLTVISPDDTKKPSRKVIVTEEEYNYTIRKEYDSKYFAYDFLRDYLGLGDRPPFSIEEMVSKYPLATRSSGNADMDWYDAIARIILKGIKRQINGPGKKPF